MTITTLKPESAVQAVDAVRWALSAGEPLEILGSGSRRGLGRPVQAGHALDLSGLSGVIAYEPEELVLTALAGTPMDMIRSMLAERGQHLAFEPPEGGTLGGLVASGLAGPRRISAGSARDHTLGIAGISGRAEAYKGGGKVVKNVTGYDVPKLMAGSFGTLTALTEITVKVLPAPEDTATLLLFGLDDAAAVAMLDRALRSPYEVSGAAHLPAGIAARSGTSAVAGAGGAVTLVRLEGFGPSVAARGTMLREELRADSVLGRDESRAVWREVRDGVGLGVGSDAQLWKLSVPPSAGPSTVEAIRRTLDVEAFYDWGGGLVWLTAPPDSGTAIRSALSAGGHATLVRAPEAARVATDVFQPLPEPLMALSRRVKESFDPKGILNPGRMYAGL
ncbi:glycolate oxidase FAD binding subunit [Azospirillum lipoferum]|uniref:Glycolate oxidase subunit GlcE n=1 Tax=Azospirillum lipoferum TaxID=193 RepID=A0A5A9GBC8_AZOLI|nr:MULTISPECIES: glycolate oxidase subunit GlcE [Azospirillum]KAA0591753.1 glycolate oxidase subunit GlcE [Azospirillum lipoferum]MCP1614854.1 glycolate oxidase FAD binding subunit [Azospirillum lipoferum]MDW5536395.1 glycolate oxidase subunit GlcE [Azospirillum sp. NL1]